MFLQDKESIWDLNWNQNLKYSDIWLQFEKSQCSYNFTQSNPDNLRKLFEIYQDEANSLIEKKLTYPALDFLLKLNFFLKIYLSDFLFKLGMFKSAIHQDPKNNLIF